jgi:hypothetical protein
MKLDSVGEIVASRKLTLVRENEPKESIEVLMGKPQQTPGHDDYYCPYQIKGMGRNKVMAIHGIDSFQAMQLALNTIGVELAVINRDSGGKLFWEGDERGNLGFPAPDWSKD